MIEPFTLCLGLVPSVHGHSLTPTSCLAFSIVHTASHGQLPAPCTTAHHHTLVITTSLLPHPRVREHNFQVTFATARGRREASYCQWGHHAKVPHCCSFSPFPTGKHDVHVCVCACV